MAMIRWMIYFSIVSSQIIGTKFTGRMGRHHSQGIDTQQLYAEATFIFSEEWTQISSGSMISISLI